jgi:hypothetical protein
VFRGALETTHIAPSSPGKRQSGCGPSKRIETVEFTSRESHIVHRCQSNAPKLSSSFARLHILDGFQRRLLLMQANRFHIEKVAKPGRTEVLNTYACSELTVHLNSFYVQLRGALDNLAWALHYEFTLLGSVGEADPGTRSRCNLFDRRFLKPLESVDSVFANFLRGKQRWFEDFKERRDPVAHRIPLYAMPGVIREGSPEEAEANRLRAECNDAFSRGDLHEGMNKWFAFAKVGAYEPMFVQYEPNGYSIRNIHNQIRSDHAEFLAVCEAALDTLLRRASDS